MALAVDGLGHRRSDTFHTHIVCGGSRVGEHSFHRLGGLPEQAVVDLDAILEGVHHIGHDSTGGGQLARALTVEDHVAQHIALDEDGIEDVIDTGQLVCLRHEAGLDTGGNAAVLAPLHPGDELDDAAQLLCRSHIIHRDVADAAGGDVLGVDLVAADQRGQDGDLAAGVAAVHIVAGVLRLGVAQLLSDLQSLVKAQILPHHLGEHEVGGAVDDAFHLGDDVGREALVHRGDDYLVLMSELSGYGRNSFKKVLNILKQERKGLVKTISLVIRFRDENGRWIRKNVTLDSEYISNYEEEVRNRYGKDVRIEVLRFHRTKPAIIDDKYVRNALAISYVKYSEDIISSIKDSILKRKLSDFKRINKYDAIRYKYENEIPGFIEEYDIGEIEAWRQSKITEEFEKLHFIDKFGNYNRSLKRDLKIRENIEKTIFENMAPTLMMWDIFRYYLTTSHNNRKINNGPFPYIRAELDRQQRKVFQTTFKKVIKVLNEFTDLKIISIPDMDLILYEKFKFEKQSKNSNILFNYPALGAGLIHEHGNIEIETIGNVLNINDSKIKKELKNIEHIRKPKSAKSKKFLDLIKK